MITFTDEINLEQLKSILDKSENLLKSTELFKTEINQDVFICNSYNEFTFFALWSRKAFAINYPITQNIFLSKYLQKKCQSALFSLDLKRQLDILAVWHTGATSWLIRQLWRSN